jgi:hypothetical protein
MLLHPPLFLIKNLKKAECLAWKPKIINEIKGKSFLEPNDLFFLLLVSYESTSPNFPVLSGSLPPTCQSTYNFNPPTPTLFNTIPKLAPHFEVPSESLLPSHFPIHFYASAHGYTVFEVEQFNKRIYL